MASSHVVCCCDDKPIENCDWACPDCEENTYALTLSGMIIEHSVFGITKMPECTIPMIHLLGTPCRTEYGIDHSCDFDGWHYIGGGIICNNDDGEATWHLGYGVASAQFFAIVTVSGGVIAQEGDCPPLGIYDFVAQNTHPSVTIINPGQAVLS